MGVKGGEGMLPLNSKFFFNKNANFTQKKLSHPNYCYLSFKALDMGAHTVLEFWDYLNKQKSYSLSKWHRFFIFWPISEFFSNLGANLGYFKGLKLKNASSNIDLYYF